MRWFVVVALAGCRFLPGAAGSNDDAAIDAIDAPVDIAIDMPAGANCYDKWFDNSIRFYTPVAVTSVNSNTYDRDPFLTADELTIYISTQRGTSDGSSRIYVAKRLNPTANFSTPVEASEFSSTMSESKLSISADNKVAVVGSNRVGSAAVDVWESIRLNVTDNWPAMNRTNVMMVETAGNEHDPTLSANAQHLYLAPDNVQPQRIAMSTRAGNGMFGPPVVFNELYSATGDADPSPTPDERILVFSSNRTGVGLGDVWYATRATSTGTFSAPKLVPDINTTVYEGDPHLSSDGCRIYFARSPGTNDWDIYQATAK